MIRYDRLWVTMEACGMTQYRLIKRHNFSAGQIGRLKKNMHVSTHTLDTLCTILGCGICDIIEYVPEGGPEDAYDSGMTPASSAALPSNDLPSGAAVPDVSGLTDGSSITDSSGLTDASSLTADQSQAAKSPAKAKKSESPKSEKSKKAGKSKKGDKKSAKEGKEGKKSKDSKKNK